MRSACRQCESLYQKTPQAKASKSRTFRNNGRYIHVVLAAKRRGLEWTITREDFNRLMLGVCTYCGDSIAGTGSSLDRVDNTNGYTLDNIVPCCKDCNWARSDRFTYAEMKTLMGPAIREIKLLRMTNADGVI